MNVERRKTERRVTPAVGEFAVQERAQLLARVDEQAREIERLTSCQRFESLYHESERELAALKAQPLGVVLPERREVGPQYPYLSSEDVEWNACLDEVARLNSSPVSAGEIPFAGFDPSFCPGSNPENPQEPDEDEARHDAVKALHDVMQAVPCASLYSLAEAVLDAGYVKPFSAGAVDERAAFGREDRYVVIKRSDLDKIPSRNVVHGFLAALAEISAHSVRIPQRQFVVVESDWPEYDVVWQMIEARITGSAQPDHSAQSLNMVPDEWRVSPVTDNGVTGFVIGTPRGEDGIRSNTSVWIDDDDPAHQLLAIMLAASPAPGKEIE